MFANGRVQGITLIPSARVNAWIKRHPLVAYFVLAFTLIQRSTESDTNDQDATPVCIKVLGPERAGHGSLDTRIGMQRASTYVDLTSAYRTRGNRQ